MKDTRFLFLSLSIVLFLFASAFTSKFEQTFLAPPPAGDLVDFDTVRIHLNDCSLEGKVCLPISLGDALKLRITSEGEPLDVSIMNGCDFDSTSAYTYSNLFGQGDAGPYILTSWKVNGQVFADTFQDMPELVGLMNGWDPMGNWVLNPVNLLITGGNSANVYDTMQVWVTLLQSPSYIGYNLGITPNGTELSFSRGFHEVILEDTINNLRDTFHVHVSCSDEITKNLLTGQTGTSCLNTDDLLTGVASIQYCDNNNINTAVSFTLDSIQNCVTYEALAEGSAHACVVLCDSLGFCDTTYIHVNVTTPGAVHYVYNEIEPGYVLSYCIDSLNTPGNVISYQVCGVTANGFAQNTIDTLTQCVTITGIAEGGTETACIVVCTDAGACDTTYYTTLVRRYGPDIVYDTVYVNQTGQYCVEQYLVAAPITGFVDFLQPSIGFLSYTLNNGTYCTQYSGLTIGTDTLGMVLSNAGGQTDTTYLIVTVLPPSAETVVDTLEVGDELTYCLPINQLAGSVFTVTNICPTLANGNVQFALDTLTLCLDLVALAPGTDTACFTICDNFGVCDTVTFMITANQTINLLPPTASNDVSITDQDSSVTIQILGNDNIPGSLIGGVIILPVGPNGATLGNTAVNTTTGDVTYTPPVGVCDITDYFQYLICNDAGCDTATVTIVVACNGTGTTDSLVYYQAFSPNDDGTNDAFLIKNAEKFAGNELWVYNRWGNQVHYTKNYRNNWDGSWNGQPLPDGVYFYIFNDGQGHTHSDCVVIRR